MNADVLSHWFRSSHELGNETRGRWAIDSVEQQLIASLIVEAKMAFVNVCITKIGIYNVKILLKILMLTIKH